jgi:hypothetical protein
VSALAARSPDLLGRAERSSPMPHMAARRRRGLDGESAAERSSCHRNAPPRRTLSERSSTRFYNGLMFALAGTRVVSLDRWELARSILTQSTSDCRPSLEGLIFRRKGRARRRPRGRSKWYPPPLVSLSWLRAARAGCGDFERLAPGAENSAVIRRARPSALLAVC